MASKFSKKVIVYAQSIICELIEQYNHRRLYRDYGEDCWKDFCIEWEDLSRRMRHVYRRLRDTGKQRVLEQLRAQGIEILLLYNPRETVKQSVSNNSQ